MSEAQGNTKDSKPEPVKKGDLIVRGDYSPTPVGRAVFTLLRGIEPWLQYSILAHGLGTSLFHRVGLSTLPPGGPPANTGISFIDGLGLSPYRLVLLVMAIGASAKHNYWAIFISREHLDIGPGIAINVVNAVLNSINSYTFLLTAAASTDTDLSSASLLIGSSLYIVGMLTELVSEIQRAQFKSDPKNKGEAYTGGLWQLARHINYGGYTLWRAGFATVGGGYALGALIGAFFFWDFTQRAIPVLNEYCEERYGAAWQKFKKDTPYRLIPYLY